MSLLVLSALSLLLVIIAAERPSVLVRGSSARFFPSWLSGPLGGLLPELHASPSALSYLVSAMLVAMFVAYLVAVGLSDRLSARWTIAAILALHVVFFLSPPLSYTDVFNYINYGRMATVDHLNPYVVTPLLEPHSDPSFALSNWHGLLSPYGPLFTQLTEALAPTGIAVSFWALKLIEGLASLATLAVIWRCAKRLGLRPTTAVAFAGLNPVLLVWGLGAVHYDSLMMFFLTLAVYLLLRARPSPDARIEKADAGRSISRPAVGAGAALAVAIALKATAGILLPIFLLSGRWRRTLAGLIPAGAVLLAAAFLSFGEHLPGLTTQGNLINTRGIPDVVGYALGFGGETHWMHTALNVVLVGAVALCSAWAWRSPGQWITIAGTLLLVLVVTISWSVPWYALWLLPFAALSRAGWLRSAVLVLSAYFLLSYMPAEATLAGHVGFAPQSTTIGRAAGQSVAALGG